MEGIIMSEFPSVEEILALNPHINKEEFEKAREVLQKLQKGRTKGSGYGLLPPFERRHITVGEGDKMDRRTIHLKRLQ
jgi:hypothetical protein